MECLRFLHLATFLHKLAVRSEFEEFCIVFVREFKYHNGCGLPVAAGTWPFRGEKKIDFKNDI